MDFSHELSVGNRAIDSKHQKIHDTIIGIASVINAREVAALPAAFGILESVLYAYFAVEEAIAEALHFDFTKHRLAHQHLLNQFQQIRDVAISKDGKWSKSEEKGYISCMTACLTRHAEEGDKPLKSVLKTQYYDFNPSLEHSQQLHDKAERIRLEASKFIDKCNQYIQEAKRLYGITYYQLEEQMILEEESIANGCESLALLKLGNGLESRLGIVDDTRIVLKQIDEIKQAYIPDINSALHALRSQFLGLSFLPA